MLLLHRVYGTTQLFLGEITEPIEWFEKQLPLSVGSDTHYQERKTVKRRLEYLAPRLLLKKYLGEERIIHYNESGRPSIDGTQISISHAGKRVALLIDPTRRISIDIENVTPRIERLAPKFVRPEELPQAKPSAAYLTLCWCAKETLFKYLPGNGIDFRDHLHLIPTSLQNEGTLEATQTHDPSIPHQLTLHYFFWEELCISMIR